MTYHAPVHIGGGLYYYAAVVRFPNEGHPYIHSNSSHANIGVTKARYEDHGVRVWMDNPAGVDRLEICHGTVQGDETVTGRRGVIGGPTGGSGGAFTIIFYDTALGRNLDLDVVADRNRVRHDYANVWFQCTRIDPNHCS